MGSVAHLCVTPLMLVLGPICDSGQNHMTTLNRMTTYYLQICFLNASALLESQGKHLRGWYPAFFREKAQIKEVMCTSNVVISKWGRPCSCFSMMNKANLAWQNLT